MLAFVEQTSFSIPASNPIYQKDQRMSTSALVMMFSSWGVISYFTVKYFLMVLRVPTKEKE